MRIVGLITEEAPMLRAVYVRTLKDGVTGVAMPMRGDAVSGVTLKDHALAAVALAEKGDPHVRKFAKSLLTAILAAEKTAEPEPDEPEAPEVDAPQEAAPAA